MTVDHECLSKARVDIYDAMRRSQGTTGSYAPAPPAEWRLSGVRWSPQVLRHTAKVPPSAMSAPFPDFVAVCLAGYVCSMSL